MQAAYMRISRFAQPQALAPCAAARRRCSTQPTGPRDQRSFSPLFLNSRARAEMAILHVFRTQHAWFSFRKRASRLCDTKRGYRGESRATTDGCRRWGPPLCVGAVGQISDFPSCFMRGPYTSLARPLLSVESKDVLGVFRGV